MTDYNQPSRNPSDNNSLNGMLNVVLRKFLQGVDDMLPAQVMAYDRDSNVAQVQPLIQVVTTGSTVVTRAQIAAVPVLQLGGGGFVISFPVNTGDLGWIKANDRDISLFKQFHQQSQPNTFRFHSFEDALFIPDTMLQGVTIADSDAENMVIQNLAGTVRISFSEHGIGINGTANPNAALDIQSTNKAFMPPRMTTSQRNAIPSPTEGMIIWNTDTHGLSSYNGSAWS